MPPLIAAAALAAGSSRPRHGDGLCSPAGASSLCACFITFDVVARSFFGFSLAVDDRAHGLHARRRHRLGAGAHADARARTCASMCWSTACRRASRRRCTCSASLRSPSSPASSPGRAGAGRRVAAVRRHRHQPAAHAARVPQGLWTFGILVFLVLILCCWSRARCSSSPGAGDEAEALLDARTYDDEAAEALEAVGAHDGSAPRAMIAVVFLLVLVGAHGRPEPRRRRRRQSA